MKILITSKNMVLNNHKNAFFWCNIGKIYHLIFLWVSCTFYTVITDPWGAIIIANEKHKKRAVINQFKFILLHN